MKTSTEPTLKLSDALPKWLQITTALESEIEKRIHDGELRLPTEAELCENYSVSLVTVRQALGSLESRGLISRKRKRGTFVLPEGVAKRAPLRIDEFQPLLHTAVGDRSELLFSEVIPTPKWLHEQFVRQMNVMKLILRRSMESEPLGFETYYVRLDCAAQLDLNEIGSSSIWRLLQSQYGSSIDRIEQSFTAKGAWPEVAHQLNVDLLSPVIVNDCVCVTDSGDVLVVASQVLRGDRFRFDTVTTAQEMSAPD